MAYHLPPVLAEGFAEFLAHTYLIHDETTPEATIVAETMLTQADPVYGAGLRLIRERVTQHGFQAVWKALTEGDPATHSSLIEDRLGRDAAPVRRGPGERHLRAVPQLSAPGKRVPAARTTR